MTSPAVIDKAARLYHEGRVSDHGPAHQYEVQGDSGTYWVTLAQRSERPHVCSCPAYGTCSHIAAAMLAHGQRERSPVVSSLEAAIERLGGEAMDAIAYELLNGALAEAGR